MILPCRLFFTKQFQFPLIEYENENTARVRAFLFIIRPTPSPCSLLSAGLN